MSLKPEKFKDQAIRWRGEFEELGEARVRDMVAVSEFNNARQRSLAETWLQEREESRLSDAAIASSQREEKSLDLAEEANRLAEAANEKAEAANTTAIAALAAAVISIIVSIAIAFTSTGN